MQAAEKLKMRLPNFAEKTISEYRGAGAHLRMFFQGDPGIGPGDRFGGQHYRYPAFFQVLSSEKIPFPSGLFCQDDRYASERGLIDGIPLSRQVLREGVTERELLLIHRHVANRDCAVIYSPCALAEILPTFGVWRTVVIGLQEAAFRLWVANETIRELMQIGRLSIHHVNLGSVAVNNLGYPSAPAGLQFVERYVRTVIRTLPIAPDTFILIGRYRVAAGLAAILESE